MATIQGSCRPKDRCQKNCDDTQRVDFFRIPTQLIWTYQDSDSNESDYGTEDHPFFKFSTFRAEEIEQDDP
jgi:hypothetical protein